nr:hypothetical protein [Clavibacter sp. VKM Ac-2872]
MVDEITDGFVVSQRPCVDGGIHIRVTQVGVVEFTADIRLECIQALLGRGSLEVVVIGSSSVVSEGYACIDLVLMSRRAVPLHMVGRGLREVARVEAVAHLELTSSGLCVEYRSARRGRRLRSRIRCAPGESDDSR